MVTYRFELIVRVGDTRRVELVTEIVARNDIPSNAREWTGTHADQQSLAGGRRLEDLLGTQCTALLLLPRQGVNDLLVHRNHNGVRRVSVGIGLRDHQPRTVVVALVRKPTGAFRDEGQDHNAQDRENALKERRGAPCPRGRPLPGAQGDARRDERADVVEVIEQSDAPGSPATGKRLGEVHAGGDAGDGGAEAQNDARYDKHGDVLGGGLQDDANDGHDGAPEERGPATEPVGDDT